MMKKFMFNTLLLEKSCLDMIFLFLSKKSQISTFFYYDNGNCIYGGII